MKTMVQILEEKNLNGGMNSIFGTDKESDHMYCSLFYENEFLKYRDREIDLCEVGVHTGGSVVLWSEYFSKVNIVGLDVKGCANIGNYSNINFQIKDGYNEESVKDLGPFDIIIDDGPHSFHSQLKFVDIYTKKLKPGGTLVVEDIEKLEYTDEFKKFVPANMTYEVIDLRNNPVRYDSILFVVRN